MVVLIVKVKVETNLCILPYRSSVQCCQIFEMGRGQNCYGSRPNSANQANCPKKANFGQSCAVIV